MALFSPLGAEAQSLESAYRAYCSQQIQKDLEQWSKAQAQWEFQAEHFWSGSTDDNRNLFVSTYVPFWG